MTDKPAPDEVKGRVTDDPAEDVEAHSLALVMGIGALDRSRGKDRTGQKARDEELPPLSKPFPSMKDEKRK